MQYKDSKHTENSLEAEQKSNSVVLFFVQHLHSLQAPLYHRAVKHLCVLGCPTPSPSIFMLVRMQNTVMVWDDAFSLGNICNLFSQGNIPALFLTALYMHGCGEVPLTLSALHLCCP